jgi:hypothetical protein
VPRRPKQGALTVAAAAVACLAGGLVGPSVTAAARPADPARATASPAVAGAVLPRAGGAAGSPFCQRLARYHLAALAAWAFCQGPQPHRPAWHAPAPGEQAPAAGHRVPGASANVDAASPAEDVAPSGLRLYGQSNASIAASGRYVVEAWSDATGLVTHCPSPKAQATGLGFSSDGGKTFTDLKGPPDARCAQDHYRYIGYPSVAAYRAGGHTYFYIASTFVNDDLLGRSFEALAACQVTGPPGRASLRCSQPVIAAASSQCRLEGPSHRRQVCSDLDRVFLAADPARGRLYAAFTEFGFYPDAGAVEASVCDLGTPAGQAGPAGGTPAAPACQYGTPLRKVGTNTLAGKPYLTIQQPDPNGCENIGAYPAADTARGDLYVGWEDNFAGALGPCRNRPTRNMVAKVPRRCLALRAVSPCAGPSARASVPITSIPEPPGYFAEGGPNDFPRLAVSDQAHTVSMVWNDARLHPYGDVLLQSFTLASLRPVQARPVVLDAPHHGGMTLMPAVSTTADGLLDATWYSRDSLTTTYTAIKGAIGVSPRATRAPATNITITSVPSDWRHQVFDIFTNFGEHTDNALDATSTKPYVGSTLYVAWTDGRTGVPQPFAAHLPAGR